MSADRDACRELETTGRAKFPSLNATNVELHLVRNAIERGLLPRLPADPLPRLRWPLVVRLYEHGHEAQPGLALLQLARGQVDDARRSIERAQPSRSTRTTSTARSASDSSSR